jgi:hypothetical protein
MSTYQYLNDINGDIIYEITRYLDYNSVYIGLKYTNKSIHYLVSTNKKLQKRTSRIYIMILSQQKYLLEHKTIQGYQLDWLNKRNLTVSKYCETLLRKITINNVSKQTLVEVIKIINSILSIVYTQ